MYSIFKSYFDRYRVLNVFLLLLGVVIYVSADWYWSNVCAVKGCPTGFIGAYLAPLREAGLVIAAVTFPFLFLPTTYFRTWIIWLGVPIALYSLFVVLNIDPNGSKMFNATRHEVVNDMLYRWPTVTLIFIAWYWWRQQKQK